MEFEDLLGGFLLLLIIILGAVLIFIVGSFVYDVVTPDEQPAPQEQPQPVVQNQTVAQPQPVNSDYNIDYWKNRIQERKIST